MEAVETRLPPKTFSSYSFLVKKHIVPELGHIKVTKLTADQLQSFYTKKLFEGLSRRSVQYLHAIIHKALDQAMKWGVVYVNVADLTNSPKPTHKTPDTWTSEQAKKFLDVIRQDRLYPLYVLAITVGLRQAELLGIYASDLDMENGYLHVQIISEGLIFHTASGKPISQRNLQRHFTITCDKIELPHIRFHDLRHTCATLLLQADVHPKWCRSFLDIQQSQ